MKNQEVEEHEKGFQRQLNLDFYLYNYMIYRENTPFWLEAQFFIFADSVNGCHPPAPEETFGKLNTTKSKSDCVKGTPTLSVIRERWRHHSRDTSILEMRAGFPNSKTERVLWQRNSMFSSTLSELLQNNAPGWFAQRKLTAQLCEESSLKRGNAGWEADMHWPPSQNWWQCTMQCAPMKNRSWMPPRASLFTYMPSPRVPGQRRECTWHRPKLPADSQGRVSQRGDLFPSEEVRPMTPQGFQTKRGSNSSVLALVNISGPFHRTRKLEAFNWGKKAPLPDQVHPFYTLLHF